MLSAIRQSQNNKYDSIYVGYLERSSSWRQSNGGRQGLREGENGAFLFNMYWVQFCKMQRAVEMGGGDGCTTTCMYLR